MLKNNMYIKIILFFVAVTIMTIVTLSYLLFSLMSDSIVQSKLQTQHKAMERVSQYINEQHDEVDEILQEIYQDAVLTQGLSYLLQHSFGEYMTYRLEQAYNNITLGQPDVLRMLDNRLKNQPQMNNIILYSDTQQYLYALNQNREAKLVETNAAHSYVPDVMAMDSASISIQNIWVSQAIMETNPRLFSVRTSIRDPQSLRSIGELWVYFNSDSIKQVLSSYDEEIEGYIIVLSSDGQVIFDSSETYYGKKYPYLEQINTLSDTEVLEERSFVTTLSQHQLGYIVASVAPVSEIAKAYDGLRNTILFFSVLGIVLASAVSALFVLNYAKRTNRIIKFMRKTEQGNLSLRLPETSKDELGQISKGINDMLEELSLYIERSFKAEIKQKHTELAALQAKINPHFLYNTLEVIRMRAISQGAHDVGEMIYSLAVLFKSLVQDKSNHTLRDELELCRLYLELFRIRYKDRFTYSFECEESLLPLSVPRLLLQPIVENYIVHGMRKDTTMNKIMINILEEHKIIVIKVQDNGRGISADRLSEIDAALANHSEIHDSFGLRNVHERLKLMYGDGYGIEVMSKENVGTTITIRFPLEAGGKHDV